MAFIQVFARSALVAAVGAGAGLLGGIATAPAQPAPASSCTAADLAEVMSGVTAATATYLFDHPPVNEFFTNLGNVPHQEKRVVLANFMDANPEVKADLAGIRQPAEDFRVRCGAGPGLLAEGLG
ncbi:MAG: heme-binding protein [Mycolicibacterium sp.]|uniref:heme-binding protein n=1 Tax=Mycolicibacterium sp. TaxID=2320850 RepID=UPI003D0B2A19